MLMKREQDRLGIEWRKFYRTVIALVVPMALQNLINVGVTAADVIMLGAVGEDALSGASLAGQVQYIMTLFLFGLTSGATVLTAQYWGKGDRDAIEKILGIAVKSAVFVTALFTVAALAVPGMLLKIFTSDPVVIAEGIRYLRIVAFTYIMIGITQAYLYIMRSVERVIVATVVYLLSLICNIIMNSIFIFGLLGLPAMGVSGAALGTLCARILEVILVAGYARLFNKDIKLRLRYVIHTDKVLFSDFNPGTHGKPCSGGKFCGTGGKAACDGRFIRTFQRGGDLSREDDRGEKDGACPRLCEEVHRAQPDHGHAGRGGYPYCLANCNSFSVSFGGSERLPEDHVFCNVLFCSGTGVQYHYGGWNIPVRRGYEVRSDPGCEHDVVLLHSPGIPGCLCI